MFRESYVNKYELLRRLLFPIELNGTVVSLGCRMVKGGTTPPVASISPGTQKIKTTPKSFQNPDISPRFLIISSLTGTRGESSRLEKRQFFLCREMFTHQL